MKNFNSGFTLIELLVVIAIIGILAAVAMVNYRNYIIKAKLAEVENAMAIVESAVSEYRLMRKEIVGLIVHQLMKLEIV